MPRAGQATVGRDVDPDSTTMGLCDRRGTSGPGSTAANRPPLIHRSTQRWLAAAALLLVVYGTLGPIAGGRGPWYQAPAQWCLVPPATPSDANDRLTNLLVYIPVGAAFRLIVRRRGWSGWPDLVVSLGLATGLSYATELLQQALPGRQSSRIDLYWNAAGAIIGALAVVPAQGWLRRFHATLFERLHRPGVGWHVCTWAAIAATLLVMTAPWQLHRPATPAGWATAWEWADPLRAVRFLAFAALGMLLFVRLVAAGRGRAAAVCGAFLRLAALALVAELAQSVLSEHVSSLSHALTAMCGSAAGAIAGTLVFRAAAMSNTPDHRDGATTVGAPTLAPVPTVQRLAALGLVGVVAAILLGGVVAELLYRGVQLDPRFSWTPFRAHFRVAFTTALADATQSLAMFGTVTLLALAGARRHGPPLALMSVGTTALLLEVGRAFVAGRSGDVTTIILALLAWAATCYAWRKLVPSGTLSTLVQPVSRPT